MNKHCEYCRFEENAKATGHCLDCLPPNGENLPNFQVDWERWLYKNLYHTTLCDKNRRELGKNCTCGRSEFIAEFNRLRYYFEDHRKYRE